MTRFRPLAVLVAALCVLVGLVTLGSTTSAAASTSWQVKAQHRLDRLGCAAGRADGRLDRQTRSAVIRFQSRHHLRQSGRLDRRTRHLLFADHGRRCDRRPVPARSGHGRRIVVSQRQNWVWLVGPAGRTLAQGGMVDNTRVLGRGSYAVGSYCGRAARIKHNQSADLRQWLDNFVRFAPCGIGFHRIPRAKSTGRQIHADWILGTDLATSHGCIRLSRPLSLRVWDFTSRHTRVRVV